MPALAIGFGVALIVLGIGGYLGTDRASPTALIPAGFGLPLVLLGLLAFKDGLRKHAMHAAAMLALIGFVVPAFMALPKLPTLLAGRPILRADGTDASTAVMLQSIMALICVVFLGLCINSFIAARRRRKQAEA